MQIKSRTFLEVLGGIALVFVFLMWTITAAQASDYDDDDDGQQQDQHQKQYQDQGQDQGQSQTSNNVNDNSNAGNSQVTNFNEAARPDDITIRNTAAARIPNVTATSPCVYGWSGGLGIAGANIGGGKQKIDPECNIRETARTFAALGEIGQALIIACSSETALAALGDACGLSPGNVYVRVNETVRYVERATGGDTAAVHDVSDEAVEACSDAATRSFEACQGK